jgi:hypothetical protein
VSDEPVVQEVPAAPPGAKAGGFKGFFATTLGKIVVIGGAIGALAAILGVVAFILLTTYVNTALDSVTTTPAPGGAVGATSTPAAEATAVPAVADIQNRDVFSPRNPFVPVFAPLSSFNNPNAPSTTAGQSSTPYLEDIITEGGVRKALVWIAGTKSTVVQGDTLPNSHWYVEAIGTTTVTLREGETWLTLRLPK